MNVIHGLENVPPDFPACAVAVGVFDGVHWGHRAIFERLNLAAGQTGLVSAALTFDRHPAEVLAPARSPLYINTLDQRIELIAGLGVSRIVVAEFSAKLAGLDREVFVKQVLMETMKARQIVVGSNFRFGRDRAGDIRYLVNAAPVLGVLVAVVPAVVISEGPVSSTRVRELVGRGDVEAATKLLGRRFALRGTVVAGRRVGRELGFPTANVETAPRQLVPANGVYVVEVTLGLSTYPGLCSIGTNPTFGGGPLTIEVHLRGFEEEIYGRRIDVVFLRLLRDEMTFESAEHLAEQIRRDLAALGEGFPGFGH